jgi:perosamine synthetase
MKKLALLGGEPAIAQKLPAVEDVSGRMIGDEELALVTEVIKSGKLNYINGPKTSRFENEFAGKYGVRYAAACSSGTASLHGAVISLDLEPLDEVIVAPITDMGTIIPILMQNLVPVFADVDPEIHNIDPEKIEAKVTVKTRAIIVVHMFGHPVDMDPVLRIARKYNLYVIEDCCQAFMTKYKGKLCGTIGDIGCFSFQQSKHITTGDGGMIITNNDKLGRRIKLCIDKGWPRDGEFRDHLFLAPAYHMTEMQSAVGIAQLAKLDMIVESRRKMAKLLTEMISDIKYIAPPAEKEWAFHTYWKYPIKVEMDKFSADMDMTARALKAEGLECWAGYTKVPIYMYNVLTVPYTYGRSGYPLKNAGAHYGEGLCPEAEKDLKEMIVLPINEKFEEVHIEAIYTALKKVFGHYCI